MKYGVTDDGFERKPYSRIIEDLKERAKEYFGEQVDLSPTSPLMQLLQTYALEIARMWEMAEHMYYNSYLTTAENTSLDRIALLMGVERKSATNSTGMLYLYNNVDVNVSEGSIAQTSGGTRFSTSDNIRRDDWIHLDPEADVENKISYWSDSVEYEIGDHVKHQDQDEIYVCINAHDDVEPLVHQNWMQYWSNVPYDTNYYSNIPIMAIESGTQSNVASQSVVEPVDMAVSQIVNWRPTLGGSGPETDSALRARVLQQLDRMGKATLDALEAAILEVDQVSSVSIEELDDRSLSIVIESAEYEQIKDEVKEQIDATRAFGIPYDINPVDIVQIYVEVNFERTDDAPPRRDAHKMIGQAIQDYVGSRGAGDDVLYSKMYDVIFNVGDWVYDVTQLKLGKDPQDLYSENVVIDSNENSSIESIEDNIDITSELV